MSVLVDRLQRHVERLAGVIGERNVWRPAALHAAADYIRAEWRAQSFRIHEQIYELDGVECANLEIGSIGGSESPLIIVGAHYDSVAGSPGANDNASGVAALLELSRLLRDVPGNQRLRFVAFVNEESPFFATDQQGSEHYAKRARQSNTDIELMIALETIGYYSDSPGSQAYPPLLRWFYPSRADFLAMVANVTSRKQLRRFFRAFRESSEFPARRLAAPAVVPGLSWSDHRAFWRYGYPAIMITDTAFYRYPYYHTPLDTSDRVCYAALEKVTLGLAGALGRLLSR